MNKNEYMQAMKRAVDKLIKDDEKIQQFLVWLHEKTTSLGSPYQESALRLFYCNIAEGVHQGETINRRSSQILDSNLDKDIDEVRGIACELMELGYAGVSYPQGFVLYRQRTYWRKLSFLVEQVNTLPAVDIVVDRNLSLVCDGRGGFMYLRTATALLIRDSDKQFQKLMINFMNDFPIREDPTEEQRGKLRLYLSEHRNLKLDWQFGDEQKKLLDNYYAANKLLVDCLRESNASPELQKEIQDTLLLPIVEIERRKNGILRNYY